MHLTPSKLIFRAVIAGFSISALFMVLLVGSAYLEFFPAVQALVLLSQPRANPLSMALQAIAPGAFENQYSAIAIVLISAWVQFAVVASALIAAGYAIFGKVRASASNR